MVTQFDGIISDKMPIDRTEFSIICCGGVMKKSDVLRDLFLLFVIFAVCGWIYEVVLTLIAYGRFENRGFLYGAWLPIYGFGGLILYFSFRGRLTPIKPLRVIAVFSVICAAATLFELAASYLLDAVGVPFYTLWDYYTETPNFDGRIGLISSLRFGALGAGGLYLVVPLWEKLVKTVHRKALDIAGLVLGALFLADLTFSVIARLGNR